MGGIDSDYFPHNPSPADWPPDRLKTVNYLARMVFCFRSVDDQMDRALSQPDKGQNPLVEP